MYAKQKRWCWVVHLLFNSEYNPLISVKAKLDHTVALEKKCENDIHSTFCTSCKTREIGRQTNLYLQGFYNNNSFKFYFSPENH